VWVRGLCRVGSIVVCWGGWGSGAGGAGLGGGGGGGEPADISVTRSSSKIVFNPSRTQIELNLKSAPFGAIVRLFWWTLK